MGHEDADAWEVFLTKLPPQALVEAADTVVSVRSALPVRDAVEEVAVVCSFLPHAFHLSTAWLEVAKVLLSQTRLFIHFDRMSWKGRRGRIITRQGAEDAFGGLSGTAVR